MKIFVVDHRSNIKEIGNYPNIPIPHKGDKINLGFNPSSDIEEVVFDYINKNVYIVVDFLP